MSLKVETPSRIWRRIQDCEARNGDMPSLPSLPVYDESYTKYLSSSRSSVSADASTTGEQSESSHHGSPVTDHLVRNSLNPAFDSIPLGNRTQTWSRSRGSSRSPDKDISSIDQSDKINYSDSPLLKQTDTSSLVTGSFQTASSPAQEIATASVSYQARTKSDISNCHVCRMCPSLICVLIPAPFRSPGDRTNMRNASTYELDTPTSLASDRTGQAPQPLVALSALALAPRT